MISLIQDWNKMVNIVIIYLEPLLFMILWEEIALLV